MRRDPVKTGRAAAAAVRRRQPRPPPVDLPPDGAPVFERLRAWRGGRRQGAGRARVRDLPRRDAAADRHPAPTTLAELGRVSGIGEAKLARYGQQVLDVLAEAAHP